MASQYNVITGQSVTMSPLDFCYEFGLNDNSSQYFNYTDYSILTNATSQIESEIVHTQFESTLLEGFPKDTVVGVEISSVPLTTLEWTSTLSLSKVSTDIQKEFQGNKALALDITKDILNTTVSVMSSISSGGSVLGTVMSFAQLGGQIASTTINLLNEKENTKTYVDWANKQVELYNEKTEANYEFIQQATEVFQKRAERFEKSNKVINSKQKSRSKSF
jgi:hypothetical protein